MITALSGVAKAVAELKDKSLPKPLKGLAGKVKPGATEQAMADHLLNNDKAAVMLGNLAIAHPAFSQLGALAAYIAQATDSILSYLPEAANSVGGWLAGVLPHRVAGGGPAESVGLDAHSMLDSPRKAYVLLGVEPEFDCWDSTAALTAIKQAEFVLSLTPYAEQTTRDYADVILPIGTFAETSGSYVNAEGRCQSFRGVIRPLGEARPAWKVLRVLGNQAGLAGFDYLDSEAVLNEVLTACKDVEPDNRVEVNNYLNGFDGSGLWRVSGVPIYAVDAIVRRAKALQQTSWAGPASIHINPKLAQELGLAEAAQAALRQNGAEVILPLALDTAVPTGCVWVPSGVAETAALGPSVGLVELAAAS